MTEPVQQTDAIRDYVFPIFELKPLGDGEVTSHKFRGTGFFFGNRNFALTCAHVIANPEHMLAILVAVADGWRVFTVQQSETHATEDVAVMQIEPPDPNANWRPVVQIGIRDIRSGAHYFLFGYPEDAALELADQASAHGGNPYRPDLVYSEGHVRRRLTNVPLPMIKGSSFFELSGVAGGGCSGSPLISMDEHRRHIGPPLPWSVVGIYVGERVNERATSVGYAVRIDAIGDWRSEILGGRTLVEESQPEAG